MRVLRLPTGLVGRKVRGNGSPVIVPREQSQCPGMGDVGGQPAQLICSPALQTAALVCRGMARMMQDSDGWEMARGAARMIHSDTEEQSGSSKVKGRERGNKSPNSLISEKCPAGSHCTEELHEMVLQHAQTAPSSSGFRGTRHPHPQWVTGSWFLPGRSTGVCTDPCQSSSHNKK